MGRTVIVERKTQEETSGKNPEAERGTLVSLKQSECIFGCQRSREES